MLVDKDLANDINLYLQEIGKDITAMKLVHFLACPEVKEKHRITKKISERTACRYLNALGYQYRTPIKGQYADGHECEDVVWYRDHKFLLNWKALESRMENWTSENEKE